MLNDPYEQLALLNVATGLVQPGGPDQQTGPLVPIPQQIAALAGPDMPEAEGLPTSVGELRVLIRTMLGQSQVPSGNWGMSMNRSATRLNLLEPRVTLLEQLVQQYAAGASATNAKVQLLNDRLALLTAAQTASDARQTADEVRLATLEAKDVLQANAIEANRLDIVALKAADMALQTRLATDEAAAKQARDVADAALAKAEQNATSLLALQAQLTTAQATAAAAQAAAAANATVLAGKLDAASVQRFITPTPAVNLAVGTPYNVPVALPKAWPNGNYLVFFTKASGSTLLNVQLSDTAKTGTGFNLTMQTTGLAQVAIGASSAEVLTILIS